MTALNYLVALALLSVCYGQFTVTWTEYGVPGCSIPFGQPKTYISGECKLPSGGNVASKVTCSGPYSDATWVWYEYFNQGQTVATCNIDPWKNATGKGDECVFVGGGLYAIATCGDEPAPTDVPVTTDEPNPSTDSTSSTSSSSDSSTGTSSGSSSGSNTDSGTSSSTSTSSTNSGSTSSTQGTETEEDTTQSTGSDESSLTDNSNSLIPSAVVLLALALFCN